MLRLLKKNKITKWGFAGVELLILMTLIVGVAAATRLVQQSQNPQKQAAVNIEWKGERTNQICDDINSGAILYASYSDGSCSEETFLGYTFSVADADKCDRNGNGSCYRVYGDAKDLIRNSKRIIKPKLEACIHRTNNKIFNIKPYYERCTPQGNPSGRGNCAPGNDCCATDEYCPGAQSPIGQSCSTTDCCELGGCVKKSLNPPPASGGKWVTNNSLAYECTGATSSKTYWIFSSKKCGEAGGETAYDRSQITCSLDGTGTCWRPRGSKTLTVNSKKLNATADKYCEDYPSPITTTYSPIIDECKWLSAGCTSIEECNGTCEGYNSVTSQPCLIYKSKTECENHTTNGCSWKPSSTGGASGSSGPGGPGGGPPGGGPGPGDGGGTGGQCSKESSSKCGGQNIGDSCGSGGSCSNPRNEQGSDGKPLCKCKGDKPGADIGGNTKGYHDGDYGQSGRCAVFGWTCDPDKIDQPVTVRIRQGPNVLAEVAADQPAEDAVKNICAGTANHRFEYIAPADSPLRDGQPHTITVEAKNVDDLGNFVNEYVELGNTPYQMTCAAGAPPTCKRCSYNYDFCQAQWPDVGGCGIPAPGTTVDYSLDFSCPVATPQPGATDTTCPDKDNLQSCSRCSSKYKYLYADFASKDGCLTSVDDTQIHKKYKVDCSCTDGQDAADFTLYPYINKTEYDACFLESTITPTPTVDPNFTPPPSPTPTGMWWYTPEGEKCDSTNYRAFLTVLCPPEFQDVLTNSVGFTTEGIPDQTPCDLTSGEKCWGVGGSEVTDLNTEVIKSYKDFKTSCVSQPPDQLPAKMYSRIWECGWREDPDSQVEGEVIINFADSNDFDFIYVYLLETLNPRNLRFFEIKKADASGNVDTITGQAKTYQMANLFSGTTYKIYAKVYKKDTDSGSIREINALNQIENLSPQTATCDDASCEFIAVKNSSAKFNFTLTLPQSQPVGQGGGGDQSSNEIFQQMIVMYGEEKLTALDVSRFILQLTRNPGLQKETCSPVIPGGCEFGK